MQQKTNTQPIKFVVGMGVVSTEVEALKEQIEALRYEIDMRDARIATLTKEILQ